MKDKMNETTKNIFINQKEMNQIGITNKRDSLFAFKKILEKNENHIEPTSEFNQIYLNINKHKETPLNQIYNTILLETFTKKIDIKMTKEVQGIFLSTNIQNLFVLLDIYPFEIEEDLHKRYKNNMNFVNIQTLPMIHLEPSINNEDNKVTQTIIIDIVRLFQMLRSKLSDVIRLLLKYNSTLIIGNECVTLLCSDIKNKKVLYHSFIEMYYREYTIKIEIDNNDLLLKETIKNNMIFVKNETNKTYKVIGSVDKLNLLRNVSFPKETSVEFVVDSETSGFLSGKKYGKTNKIIRETETEIDIESINGDDLYKYTIKHSSYINVINALEQLNMEYPSQLLFSVDYKHHKKIIGTSGKHIQRIMKKYDVYVKFMNEKEAQFYPENVICKTPRKNESNLKLLQEEITQKENKKVEEVAEQSTKIEKQLPKLYELMNMQ